MKHLIGLNDERWQKGEVVAVVQDTDELINAHMMIAGMTGTGKSYQIEQYLGACIRNGVVVDVMDVAEELDFGGPHSCAVKYSAATRHGYNPLVIYTNEHSGGPVNQIHYVVDLIHKVSGSPLGTRQVRALHNLIGDLYHLRGIYPDNPRSWYKKEITERQWQEMKNAHDYGAMRDFYPTLGDLEEYAERKVQQLKLGTTGQCVTALNRVMSSASKMQSINSRYGQAPPSDQQKLADQLAREKEKAKDAYNSFVDMIETGREFMDAVKYTDSETLEGVLDRVRAIRSAGIFNSNPPRFGDALIRVHGIKDLRDEFKNMHVYSRAEHVLRECIDSGKQTTLRRVFLVDEAHRYYTTDRDNPLNRIANEGRKWGLALVMASPSPKHFSEEFFTACGTTMLLGINEKFWPDATRLMGIPREDLARTRAKEMLMLKMHKSGEQAPKFAAVNVNAAAVRQGIRAEIERHKAEAQARAQALR
jgi:hypothetical protein